jgi:FdhD protein
VTPDPESSGNVIRALLREPGRLDLERLRRNVYTGSSCGVCGKASLERALATAPPLADAARFPEKVLCELPERLRAAQRGFDETGGLHAAALFDASGELLVVREDVGRHNAVDKVVGWAALEDRLPLSGSGLLVSGRISFEIVQKALAARIPLVAAVSAPTSLAVALAEAGGVALVGFLRGRRFNLYGARERIA